MPVTEVVVGGIYVPAPGFERLCLTYSCNRCDSIRITHTNYADQGMLHYEVLRGGEVMNVCFGCFRPEHLNPVEVKAAAKPNKPSKLTIGSDPEFVWYNRLTGKVIRPVDISDHNLISSGLGGPIGADGASGGSQTGELRPSVGSNAYAHIESIRELIATCYHQVHVPTGGIISMASTSVRHSIGGHIHFGHPDLQRTKKARVVATNNLDYWLLPLLSPFCSLEGHKNRVFSEYGHLGSFREADWGMEYRSPASWLFNEQVASAVLRLAYLIVSKTLSGDIKTRNTPEDLDWATRMSCSFLVKGSESKRLRKLRQESLLKLTKGHPAEQEAVEVIFHLLEKGVSNYDIFEGWGFPRIALPEDTQALWDLAIASQNTRGPLYWESSNSKTTIRNLERWTDVPGAISGDPYHQKLLDKILALQKSSDKKRILSVISKNKKALESSLAAIQDPAARRLAKELITHHLATAPLWLDSDFAGLSLRTIKREILHSDNSTQALINRVADSLAKRGVLDKAKLAPSLETIDDVVFVEPPPTQSGASLASISFNEQFRLYREGIRRTGEATWFSSITLPTGADRERMRREQDSLLRELRDRGSL